MTIDDAENYYEASSDSWERFAWLRARPIAGAETVGLELLQRMRPFIYMRSLSTDDLDRFLDIKHEMSLARKRHGHWNVKVGEGGIRDIEFFVQTLQIVNAASHKELQTTNTINIMAGLETAGLITEDEEQEIYHSYLYLRRLENRLQMIDEQQTHELPDDHSQRLIIARSLAVDNTSDKEVLNYFENELYEHQTLARTFFDRILPSTSN